MTSPFFSCLIPIHPSKVNCLLLWVLCPGPVIAELGVSPVCVTELFAYCALSWLIYQEATETFTPQVLPWADTIQDSGRGPAVSSHVPIFLLNLQKKGKFMLLFLT